MGIFFSSESFFFSGEKDNSNLFSFSLFLKSFRPTLGDQGTNFQDETHQNKVEQPYRESSKFLSLLHIMESLSCIIIEDDNASRALLTDLLTQVDQLELKGDFANPIDAYQFLSENFVDVVFLDVEMPEMSGIELAKMIPFETNIVVTTSKKEYALDAFGINAFDFILKPVDFPKLVAVCNKLESVTAIEDRLKPLFIKSKQGYIRIPQEDLIILQAYGDYVRYITRDKTYLARQSFKDAMDTVKFSNFIRIHRSYAVNLEHVKGFDQNSVMINDEKIPVSRSFKSGFLAAIKRIE